MSLKKLSGLILLLLAVAVPVSVSAIGVARNVLTIDVQSFETSNDLIVNGGAPKGHVVRFGGWFDMRLLVTHQDGLLNQKLMPLLKGKEVGHKGFYFAGVQDDLYFVRSGSSLQLQRETRDEQSVTPNVREPLFTMYLPTTVKVQVK